MRFYFTREVMSKKMPLLKKMLKGSDYSPSSYATACEEFILGVNLPQVKKCCSHYHLSVEQNSTRIFRENINIDTKI